VQRGGAAVGNLGSHPKVDSEWSLAVKKQRGPRRTDKSQRKGAQGAGRSTIVAKEKKKTKSGNRDADQRPLPTEKKRRFFY